MTQLQSMRNEVSSVGITGSLESSMTSKILKMMSLYEKVGIVSRDRLEDVPPDHHPSNIMSDFQSMIVLARVPRDLPKERVVGKFHYAIGTIAAQDAVTSFLKQHGYKYQLIGSRSTKISLPRLAERAGVGELSPFRTLAVKGFGLRAVLSAIITDAPLEPSPLVTDACPRREACLKRCAALGDDRIFDRTKCTSCGACVKHCPDV